MRRFAPIAAVLVVLAVPAFAHATELATNAEGDVATYHFEHFMFANPATILARRDQALDPVTSFGRNGFIQARAQQAAPLRLELDDAGRVLEAWNAGYTASGAVIVRRRLPGGRPDESFGPRGERAVDLGGRQVAIADLLVAGPDRILLAGGSPAAEGQPSEAVVVALRADGTPDPAFGDGGVAAVPMPHRFEELEALADGRILAETGFDVARFTHAGELDPAFGAAGVMALGDDYWDVASSGDGVLLARSLGTEGIEVRRRLENGAPDPDWGDGGATVAPLDGDEGDEETGTPRVAYYTARLVPRAEGATVVATRHEEVVGGPVGQPTVKGVPVLFDPEGAFERTGDRADRMQSVEPMPGGGFAGFAAYSYDECGCEPGDGIVTNLVTYDAAGELVARATEGARRTPPDVTIDSGPSPAPGSVTGPSASFAFTVTPAAAGEDTALECTLNDGPQGPCPADGVFDDLPEGPAVLRVVALGVHGAPSVERTWEWTVNHRAPTTTITSAPSGTTQDTGARIEFSADEQSTFSCALDDREPVACHAGAFDVSGLAPGEHRVTVRATDRFGAAEASPPAATWTVAPRAETPPPPAPPAPQPGVQQPVPPPPPPTGQTGPRVKVLVVGKVRKGRVRVRFLPFDTGQVQLLASVVTRKRTRAAGTRLLRTRGGQARTVTLRLSARGRRILRRAAARGERPRIAVRAVMIEG